MPLSAIKILLFTSLLLQASLAFAAPAKMLVAVFGDSVTKGAFANSALGNPGLDFYLEANKIIQRLEGLSSRQHALLNNPASNPAAFTQLMERTFGFVSHPELSGAAGNQPYSFPSRLGAYHQRPIKVLNVALLSGSYQQAQSQLNKLALMLGYQKPEYIVLNFSVIDLLLEQPIEEFRRSVQDFLKKLARHYPRSMLIVTPILDPTPMLTLADRVSMPAFFGLDAYTCSAIRKAGYQLFVSIDENSPPEAITQLQAKVKAMNQVLKEELSNSKTGFKGRIVITETPTAKDGHWENYLAADCTHPNINGQKIIGDVLWNAYWQQLTIE